MESNSFNLILGGQKLPIDLHHLGVAEDGHVVGPQCGTFGFHFVWRNIKFTAQFQDDDGQARLDLSADLCPIPFTAESPQARIDLKAIVSTANGTFGPVLHYRQGKVVLHQMMGVVLPVTAVGLVTALAGFLLKIAPYLDCISTVMAPPLELPKDTPRLRPAYRRKKTTPGNRRV